MTVGEIERGICLQRSKDAVFTQRLIDWQAQLLLLYSDRILPVTTPIAKRWGQLSAKLGRADADVLIAATALEHGLTVVTRNERHSRLPVFCASIRGCEVGQLVNLSQGVPCTFIFLPMRPKT